SPVPSMELRARSSSCSTVQSSTATPTTGQSSRPRASNRYNDRNVITLARSPVIPKTTKTSAGREVVLVAVVVMGASPSLTCHDAGGARAGESPTGGDSDALGRLSGAGD